MKYRIIGWSCSRFATGSPPSSAGQGHLPREKSQQNTQTNLMAPFHIEEQQLESDIWAPSLFPKLSPTTFLRKAVLPASALGLPVISCTLVKSGNLPFQHPNRPVQHPHQCRCCTIQSSSFIHYSRSSDTWTSEHVTVAHRWHEVCNPPFLPRNQSPCLTLKFCMTIMNRTTNNRKEKLLAKSQET